MLTYRSTRTGVVADVLEPKEIERAGGGTYAAKKQALHRRRVLELMDASSVWERVQARQSQRPAEPTGDGPFDPGQHGVHEVNTYLAEADEAERDRVLAAEAEGKGRSTILAGPHSGE